MNSPEVVKLYDKLNKKEKLSDYDLSLIKSLSYETGWSRDDIMDEIKNLDKDPRQRIEIYKKIFEEYYEEAIKLRDRQGGEKLWGAVTALIKVYAANKGIMLSHWSHYDLYNFIASNVEKKKQIRLSDGTLIKPYQLFVDLLTFADQLHKNFYESHLPKEVFEDIFNEVVELVKKAKEIIFS
ncbi:PaREP1 family protein [Saccharolobus shibatae]|uniref:Uncharacterized protein n=1 Tax=Saccharolobus shibatae TaxID=2286 RepID=A0A8F5BVH8_9CREN|nr:PaREP1 family protein [Saccharolobus shibatae]QXJ32094.1 hypothetical protein J5U21_01745 [Saccharolobus shibatae]